MSHTTVLIEVTRLGLPIEIYPPEGQPQTVPTIRFQNWEDARRYLHSLGATGEALSTAEAMLKKCSFASLGIE